MSELSQFEERFTLQRSQSYIEKNESSTSCISYATSPASRTLRAVELEIASDARDDLRYHWKILDSPDFAINEGRRLFVAGLPRFEDDTDAVLQLCRIFLSQGFDLKRVKLLHGSARAQSSPNTDDYPYFFVDLMHHKDAKHALCKLDGVVRMDNELLISQAGLADADELMVGPLPGYQPRRKQVIEIRKLFNGLHVGEISLFYEMEPKLLSPGEDLFEKTYPLLYFCSVRLVDVDDLDAVISPLNGSIWAGRQIFVRRPRLTPQAFGTQDSMTSSL